MSKILKFKRGTTAKNNAYVGSDGELTVDTNKKTVVVHDGLTNGGSALATELIVSNHTSRVDNPHNVTKSQVGLGNVQNIDSTIASNISQDSTHRFVTDSEKTIWNNKINLTEKASANGVATLDSNGKVVLSQIPDSVLGQLHYMGVHNFSSSLPTATEKGQYWIASSDGNGYITGDWAVWNGTSFDKVDNTDAVATVAGRTGNVVLTKNDVGLSNVDNTSDANKPVSTAQQTALNLKANIASPTFTGTVTAPTFSGALSGNASSATNVAWTGITSKPTTISGYGITDAQPLDGDLTAIAGLAGTSGILKKTAVDTWVLDTNTYVTSSGVTSVSGTAPIVSSGGNTPSISISAATTLEPGSMSAADKTKLDGIATGANNYVLPTASSTVKGGVELFSDTVQSIASNAVTSTASRTYGIQLNSDGQAVVNVPWVDTNTVYTHPTGDGNLHVPATGTTNNGKVLTAGATAGSLSWTAIPSAPVSSVNGMTGDVVVTNITENAGTATKLQTARSISLTGDVTGTVNFDGSANASITTTIAANSVALGTDTTGNYVAGLTQGTGITVSGTAGEGWSPTVAITNVGTAGTYTKVTTNAQGQVTSGTSLSASDIPVLDASKITTGTIDPARLPAYVDDVLEFTNLASFPTTGETGKIYVALDTNKTYRWSGSVYIYITSGAVDSVAGKTGFVTLVKGDVGLGSVDNTADSVKNVLSATKLQAARTIGITGDLTWTSPSFDGSGNVTAAGTLANSGVTAGTYTKVTVDAKGRATAGAQMTLEDIPDSTFKKSVRCATTANLAATYASNVLTMSAVGVTTIDGITVALNDRILIKDQTTALQNGIYRVSTLGTASVATVFTRVSDADATSELASAIVAVDSGTVNGGRLFDNDLKTTDTLGTTAVTFNLIVDTGFASTVVGSTPGTAAIGTSTSYARADHVHPVQTTISGNVTSTGNTGFKNDVYVTGARNPIWYFANAPTYGISYYQSTAGIGGKDVIAFDFGTNTSATSKFYVTSDGDVRANGSITSPTFNGGRFLGVGSGNDYHLGGVELIGNGTANTIFPTLGFHQTGLYASSLQLRSGGDFRFYAQGGSTYANVTANTFYGPLSGSSAKTTVGEANGLWVGGTKLRVVDTATDDELVITSKNIRFGETASTWNYDLWAGLSYVHSEKKIRIGGARSGAWINNAGNTNDSYLDIVGMTTDGATINGNPILHTGNIDTKIGTLAEFTAALG